MLWKYERELFFPFFFGYALMLRNVPIAKNTIQLVHRTFILNIYMPFRVISTSFKHAHCSANGGLNILRQDFRPGCVEKICKWSERATEMQNSNFFWEHSNFLPRIPSC